MNGRNKGTMSPMEHDPKQARLQPLSLFYEPGTRDHGSDKTYLSATSAAAPLKIQKLASSQTIKSRTRSCWRLPGGSQARPAVISSSDETCASTRHYQKRGPTLVLRKNGKSRRRRRFGKSTIPNLTTHLLPHAQCVTDATPVPSLNNVLNTISKAWPSSNNVGTLREETPKMNGATEVQAVAPHHVLERRRSVPEEVIRKYSVSYDKTSESETNATMPEMTPPTDSPEKVHQPNAHSGKVTTQGRRKVLERSFRVVEEPPRSAEEGSSDSDSNAPGLERFNTIKKAPLRRGSVVTSMSSFQTDVSDRVSQSEYIKNGRGIIKTPATEKGSQTGNCCCHDTHEVSDTTPSAREETESAVTSDTISSPRLCTHPLSSSENQSSDSEEIKCTCAEIVSSRDTSTDPNHSGKSTLSQTVSDKSTSTQDCTISINSVSSRGSTITAATDTSSTEADPKTSAKETTDNDDQTPRPPGRGHGNHDNGKSRRQPDNRNPPHKNSPCPQHGYMHNNNYGAYQQQHTNSRYDDSSRERKMKFTSSCTVQTTPIATSTWPEELAIFNQPMNNTERSMFSNDSSLQSMASNSEIFVNSSKNYQTRDLAGPPTMVPRYSAMPKTMSMIVNTASFDGHNNCSDSDCQSLADSLEEGENWNDLNYYYDTKQELKPVRGDFQPTSTKKHRQQPRGRAYFFSMDDEGVADLETSIYKIPEIPDGLRKKIQQRHDEIHTKYENREQVMKENPKDAKRATRKKYHKKRKVPTKPKPVEKEESISTPPTVRLNEGSVKKNPKKALARVDSERKTEKVSPRLPSKIPTPIANNAKKASSKEGKPRAPPLPSPENVPPATMADSHHQPLPQKEPKPEHEERFSVDVDALTRHRLSLISSLEATALMLKAQTEEATSSITRQQPSSKRPVKFRQRFEVIPEERSSSLSSADERHSGKDRRRSLPVKLSPAEKTGVTEGGQDAEGKTFRRYSLGSLSSYVIAKLMGKPLQAIPCVQRGPNNENTQIIIFSPKDPAEHNSSKGRDALLAMNRDDFERLSKGWMNFYLLKEDSGNENDKNEDLKIEGNQQQNLEVKVPDPVNNRAEISSIVCRLPSMEKDPPTTSGSGTDETNIPPSSSESLPLKSYSLMRNNSIDNIFQLHELIESKVDRNPPTSIDARADNKTNDQQFDTSSSSVTKVRENVEIVKKVEKLTREASTSTDKITKAIHKFESTVELPIPIKMSSSNTVLKSKPCEKSPGRTCSLPELRVPSLDKSPTTTVGQSSVNSLPRIPGAKSDSDGDSDSTDYMETPSPHLPKLPLEDCCCSSDISSDMDELESKMSSPRERAHLPLRRRPLPFRPKHRYGFYEAVHGKKPGNSGWSVTVEGTMAFPRTRPDLKMRLSFPDDNTGPPIISQSDSGFVEERTIKPRMSASQKQQQWTVTVKNPHTIPNSTEKQRTSCHLPNLPQQKSQPSLRSSKVDCQPCRINANDVKQKLSTVWPKIEEMIENELSSITWDTQCVNQVSVTPLSVEGRTIPLDTRPRMTQRDLTRRSTGKSTALAITGNSAQN